MTSTRFLALLALPLAVAACGTSTTDGVRSGAPAPRVQCPRDLLLRASSLAPVGEVLGAAQRRLAHQTVTPMGRVYHLTPRNAPIVFIAQLEIDGGASWSRRVPGLLPLNARATALCGKKIARASWAIHYEIPVAPMVSSADVYAFFVKTRRGWRFWGGWCGAAKPPRWRAANC